MFLFYFSYNQITEIPSLKKYAGNPSDYTTLLVPEWSPQCPRIVEPRISKRLIYYATNIARIPVGEAPYWYKNRDKPATTLDQQELDQLTIDLLSAVRYEG